MAGRNVNEAVNNYRDPLKEVIGCVTQPILLFSAGGGYRVGNEYSLALQKGDPVKLGGEANISITMIQYFRPVEDVRKDYGPYRVSTRAYYYTIQDADGHEVLAYHWHPTAPNSNTPWPHVHLEYGAGVGRQELAGEHIPTGRVTVEDFVRLLLEVFKVPEQKPNWRDVLDRTKGRFDFYKSW